MDLHHLRVKPFFQFGAQARNWVSECALSQAPLLLDTGSLLHYSTAWQCCGLDEHQCGPLEPPRFGPLPPPPALITCLGLDFQPLLSLPRAPPTKLSHQTQVRIELTTVPLLAHSSHDSDTVYATLSLFRPRLTS